MDKPHLIFRDGLWRLYRNKWKSRFNNAAAIAARNIPALQKQLRRDYDRYRFGYKL